MNGKNVKMLLTLSAGVAISASMQTSVAMADDNLSSPLSGTVTADVLNVRMNPNTSSSPMGTLKYNTAVSILEISNGWYKINFNGTTGWVYGEYVSISSNTAPAPDSSKGKGVVTADALNFRSGAGTSYTVIGELFYGQVVDLLSIDNGWYKVSFNGKIGYVSADYIKVENNGSDTPSSPSGPSAETYLFEGSVDADALNLRSGASTSYSVICTLYYGNKVNVIASYGSWYKVNYNGTVGYVNKNYIVPSNNESTPAPNPPSQAPSYGEITGKVAVVTADVLNVRSGASTDSSIVGTVRYGYKLPIVSYSNGWYKIQSGSISGYVYGDYVKVANETDAMHAVVRETPLIESQYTREQIVEKAKEYLGVPYVWGGFTPLGFDCSGLVQYVYKQFGITLERTTYYQVHQGQIADRNNLLPGDLIFFTTNEESPNDISHVGMYVGDDMFIHAPQPGDVVRYSNLNSTYYANKYYVSKRIIK